MYRNILALCAVIIVAGGVYLLWAMRGTGGYGPVTTMQLGGTSSLHSLMERGAPIVCTFATSTAAGSETGTIYITSGMASGEFTATDSGGGSLKAHIVVLGDVSYAWTSESAQGFTTTVGTSSNEQSGSVGFNTQVNYACQAWKPNTNKFKLPSNITFTQAAQ